MKVSIIIVTYNTKVLTDECIKSVQKFTENIDYEIILVDNASTDGSKSFFEIDNSISYIYSSENLGFGRANNLGAKRASGMYLLFLNSDTLFKENSLKKLYDFFYANEDEMRIGSLGCRLTDINGIFNSEGTVMPDCHTEIERIKSFVPPFKYLVRQKKIAEFDGYKEFYEIGYVIGADLMMNAKVFSYLKGFDPAFFMYYEESDLQCRMKGLGLKAYIYTGTEIIHLEDGSGKAIKRYNNKKRMMVHTSKIIFLKKNDPQNFKAYKWWDRFFLYLARLSTNYTRAEKREYEEAVRKMY